jgi:hypothetical protein
MLGNKKSIPFGRCTFGAGGECAAGWGSTVVAMLSLDMSR